MTNLVQFSALILRRNWRQKLFGLALFGLLTVLTNPSAHAQTFTVLHNFTGGADGSGPQSGVTFDRAGNIYGTTAYGGIANGCEGCGVVYKLSHVGQGWVANPLYNFKGPAQDDGVTPTAGVVFGPDGTLYGTTYRGGTNNFGTVFQLRPPANACKSVSCSWNETMLHAFGDLPDAEYPGQGNLVFDTAGNLYGTTIYGGGFGLDCDDESCGAAYEMSRTNGVWNENVICPLGSCTFPGFWPMAGLTFDPAGNLYGTVTNTSGGVFELLPQEDGSWLSNALYSFLSQPQFDPAGGVILDAAGNV